MKKILLLYLLCTFFLLTSCNISQPDPSQTNIKPTETLVIETQSPTTTDVLTDEPTLTPTPTQTKPAYKPGPNTYGPFVFSSKEYYIYIESITPGTEIALLDVADGKKVFSGKHSGMFNIELTLLSASIIDLNFDNIPDFSFVKDSTGKRDCWLANGTIDNGKITINSYSYHEVLSSIPDLSRCFETTTIYGFDYNGSSSIFGYKYLSDFKTLEKSEDVSETFTWSIEKIAAALAGNGADIVEGEDVYIRNSKCTTVSVGGYLTIARDIYGRYYLKDMPMDGFYRISLNPNGSWSKSEKVTAQ